MVPLAVLLRYALPELVGLGSAGISKGLGAAGFPGASAGFDYPAQMSLLYQLLQGTGVADSPEGGAPPLAKMLIPGAGMGAAGYAAGKGMLGAAGRTIPALGPWGNAAMYGHGLAPLGIGAMGGFREATPATAPGTPPEAPAGAPGYGGSTGPITNEALIALLQEEGRRQDHEFQARQKFASQVGNMSQYQSPGNTLVGMLAPELTGGMPSIESMLAQTRLGSYTGHERDIVPSYERQATAGRTPLDEPGAIQQLVSSLPPPQPMPERRISVGPMPPRNDGILRGDDIGFAPQPQMAQMAQPLEPTSEEKEAAYRAFLERVNQKASQAYMNTPSMGRGWGW